MSLYEPIRCFNCRKIISIFKDNWTLENAKFYCVKCKEVKE